MIIAIFDSSKDFNKEDQEILDIAKSKKSIIILNKSDLENRVSADSEIFKDVKSNIISISALNKIGIEDIFEEITKLFNLNEINLDNEVVITNLRQKNLISKAIESVNKAIKSLEEGMTSDIVAIFIKDILDDLGSITGEIATDEIIDEIFAKFCLGK